MVWIFLPHLMRNNQWKSEFRLSLILRSLEYLRRKRLVEENGNRLMQGNGECLVERNRKRLVERNQWRPVPPQEVESGCRMKRLPPERTIRARRLPMRALCLQISASCLPRRAPCLPRGVPCLPRRASCLSKCKLLYRRLPP